MTKTKLVGLAALLLAAPIGCGDSADGNDGGLGSLDGSIGGTLDSASTRDANPFTIAPGNYKVIGFTAGMDECMLNPKIFMDMNTNPMAHIPVSYDASGNIRIGNLRGTPEQPSLGQGPVDKSGDSYKITRMNKVMVMAPSTCTYDVEVTSTVTMDSVNTFGLGVVEKQSMRSMCMEPMGVGVMCTSSWSWRLEKLP
jgi:hypothetical protein